MAAFLYYNSGTMNRFAGELKSKKVILRHEGMIAGVVNDVVINPDDGNFLGVILGEAGKKKKQKVLAEKDIIGINDKFILATSAASLGDLDDIVRIKKVLDSGIEIEKNKVYTVSNIYLGRVSEYTIDLVAAKISRLYVNPRSISKITNEHIIDASHIITIEKSRITVDDTAVKARNKEAIKGVPVKNPGQS